MKITAYAVTEHPAEIEPGPLARPWMDAFHDRHPYRCLPLNIANWHGWILKCPGAIEVTWNGGPDVSDLEVRGIGEPWNRRSVDHFCRSNFSRGIVTMHVDYIWEMEEGWNLLATGPLNWHKQNASPCTGIVESLPYTFTMNWQVMQPGTVRFEKDEPYCMVMPIPAPHKGIADCEIEIRKIADNPGLSRQHDDLRRERGDFMRKMQSGDPEACKRGGGYRYYKGEMPDGSRLPNHVNNLKLRKPVDKRGL